MKKHIRCNLNNHQRQQGAALLIIMVVLVLFFSSILLAGLSNLSGNNAKLERTSKALASAKELLISYALLSDKLPGSPGIGFLPCPDRDGDGLSDTPCGLPGTSVEGWLPWQTLGSPPLRDGSGVCLRYAVSGSYKVDPALPLLKSPPSPGLFVIHDASNGIRTGLTPADFALAVVFAPATAVAGQSRGIGAGTATTCGSSNVAAPVNRAENYLDQLSNVNNAIGLYNGPGQPGNAALPTAIPSVFIQADPADDFNDQLIWISPRDFADVYARMP